MAIIDVDFKSQTLKRNVQIKVILPIERNSHSYNKYQTLYLLHGYSGNYNDWLYNSRILKIAKDYDIAIVLPSGENSFYQDLSYSDLNFGTYVGEELIQLTRLLFPLSSKKEDTFIGGVSMGSFGSMLLGSKYHQIFGAIICLSGAYVLQDANFTEFSNVTLPQFQNQGMIECNDLDKNAFAAAQRAQQEKHLSRIYMACGCEDPLFETNKMVRDTLLGMGAPLTWKEGHGGHDWAFWDQYIEKAVDWLFE